MPHDLSGAVAYTDRLGKLLVNLQTLESYLRDYLYYKQDGAYAALPQPIHSYAVGELAPENALTDYSSMGQLIGRYNARVTAAGHHELAVDPAIVDVRDALAHGRVFLPADSPAVAVEGAPLIVKFERPIAGNARLAFREYATVEWLNLWLGRAYEMTERVIAARAL
jgi:hypothetical protein